MLRSTEAIMAGLLIIFTLTSLFKIPEVKVEDPIKVYVESLLDAYSGIERKLVFTDPYSLMLLLDAAMPHAYQSRTTVNIYKRIEVIGGINYTLPYEFYEVLPGEVSILTANSEVVGNWYQAVFAVKNNGNETLENLYETITVAIYKPDINQDGIAEPVDPESITVFTDDGETDYTIESIEDSPDRMVVSVNVRIPRIGPGEKKNIYVMYLVGDDYE